MLLFHIVILALVQGITEFLPISSSGHLVLVHEAIGKTVNDLTLDVAVHVGTLFAVLLYFRKDILAMLFSLKPGGDLKMPFMIILASVPVIIAGFMIHLTGPDWTRSLYLTGWCTLVFGILLGIADKIKPAEKDLDTLGYKDAFIIGLAQVLALIPGTSRSGITMTAARWLGYSRTESARFSMLLAIVAISGAGTLGGITLFKEGDLTLGLDALAAIIMSFVSALGAIALMMRWLEKATFRPFVIYRIILGGILLILLYAGVLDAGLAP